MEMMNLLLDVVYAGSIAGFFLLVWALAQACENLGAKS